MLFPGTQSKIRNNLAIGYLEILYLNKEDQLRQSVKYYIIISMHMTSVFAQDVSPCWDHCCQNRELSSYYYVLLLLATNQLKTTTPNVHLPLNPPALLPLLVYLISPWSLPLYFCGNPLPWHHQPTNQPSLGETKTDCCRCLVLVD